MKALIYTRVSTAMQEDKQSLYFQVEKCKDFCKLKGYEIYKILEDVQSGADDDREGFLKLQKEIDKKSFDILVVYESSRLSRKTLTMLNFILELEKAGIKFISISQPELDTTTPTGMLFFQIQSSLGEYERKQISHRVKSSKFQRAKEGKFQGGKLPLGYTKDASNNIVIDSNTSSEVINIFTLYREYKSLSKVSSLVNKPVSSLVWILKNPFYIGLLPYGRKESNINTGITKINKKIHLFKSNHAPIIDEQLFYEVQNILKVCVKTRLSPGETIFSGILRCQCSGMMYQRKFKHWKTKKIIINYRCEKCNKNISKNKIENYVFEELLNLDELTELNEINNLNLDTRITTLNQMIERLDKEREKLINLYTKGLISDEEIEIKLNGIDKEKSNLRHELDEIEKLVTQHTYDSYQNSNLQILKEVILNRSEDDIKDLKNLFKLMIKRIDILNTNPLDVIISLR